MVLTYSLLNRALCIQYIDTPPRHKLKTGANRASCSLIHRGKSVAHLNLYIYYFFLSSRGDSQICSSKLLAFPKHLPAALLSVDVLLLLMTSSPCPADLHGTRLSTKIKTRRALLFPAPGSASSWFYALGRSRGRDVPQCLTFHSKADW